MTLNDEVQTIKSHLSSTSKELETFEQESQQTIHNDHTQILSGFRHAVKSIQHAIRFLDGGQNTKLLTNANDREAAVQIEAASLNSAFEVLRKSADVGLVNVKAINVQCHEFDDRMTKIKSNLSTTHEKIACSLDLVQERLRTMRDEVEAKTKSQGVEKSKMEEMSKDMVDKKDQKIAMRFFRFAAWTASLAVPVVVVVAVGLETGAAVMGNKRKKLQAKIDAAATDIKTLKAEAETLEKQISDLEGEVIITEKLRLEATRLQKSGQSVKSLLTKRLLQYQALKEATDEFAQWCSTAHGQSEVMVVLGVDEGSMRQSIQHLIQNLKYLTLHELQVDMLLSWTAVTKRSIPTQQSTLCKSHVRVSSRSPWALITYLMFVAFLLLSFALSLVSE